MPVHAKFMRTLSVLAVVVLLSAAVARADQIDSGRAAWLLDRAGLESLALTGERFAQDEIGGGGVPDLQDESLGEKSRKGALPVLFSLVLPGSGEAYMGYKRGYFMMAADILAWTQVIKNHNDGGDKRDEYYAYADAHYRDDLLVEGYQPGSTDIERSGEGAIYFPGVDPIFSTDDLHNLPLYVTKAEDRREYYENLGKWDQFIFGWDDYTRASIDYPDIGYTPTLTRADLQQPWVSQHREIYRQMRDESNKSFKSRDRWLYVNIGLRIFSVLQSAYLSGVIGGGDKEMALYGHPVQIIAQPAGWNRGAVAATIAF